MRVLNLPKQSLASRLIYLYVGFLMTATVHVYGAYCLSGHDMGQARFFLSQAVAISAEDLVIRVATRLGIKDGALARCIGYLWVVAWCCWVFRAPVDAACAAGLWSEDIYRPTGLGDFVVGRFVA